MSGGCWCLCRYPYLKEVRKNLKYLVQSLLLDMPFLRIAIIAHGDYCDKDRYNATTRTPASMPR
jgi:hypothetical protein